MPANPLTGADPPDGTGVEPDRTQQVRSRAELEQAVIAEHGAWVTKTIMVSDIFGYLGDSGEAVQRRPLNPPVAFRVEPMEPNSGLLHLNCTSTDEWIDPYWDLTPIDPTDPQIADMRVFWCDGPSYSTEGRREGRHWQQADQAERAGS